MSTSRRLAILAWPLAMLLLYGATFRRSVTYARAESPALDCSRLTATAPAGEVAALEQCLTLDPTDVELMTVLATKYQSSGDLRRAEALYRRALEIDAKNGDLHVRLGELYRQRGDAVRARQHAEAALRWYPNFAAANALMARLPR